MALWPPGTLVATQSIDGMISFGPGASSTGNRRHLRHGTRQVLFAGCCAKLTPIKKRGAKQWPDQVTLQLERLIHRQYIPSQCYPGRRCIPLHPSPGHCRGVAESLFDLAGELRPADAGGVREGDRHPRQFRPLLLRRSAGAADRRKGQSASRCAVRRPGRDVHRRRGAGHLRGLHAAERRRSAETVQERAGHVDRHRRRSAGVHDQHQIPPGAQSPGAGLVGRPAQSRLQEHAADGRCPHLRHRGDAHLLDPPGQ